MMNKKFDSLDQEIDDLIRSYKPTDAIIVAKKALELSEEELGYEHPYIAVRLAKLADLYLLTCQYAEAEPLLKRALAIQEKTLGPDHPDLVMYLYNLEYYYYCHGQHKQAELLLKRMLAIREKTLGPEHPDVLQNLNSLACNYSRQGQFEQAEPLFKRVLAVRDKTLCPDHPDLVDSLDNLALNYCNQGQFEQAEPLFKRVLAIKEKAFGLDDILLIQSLENLARIYYYQGQFEQAEPLFKRAVMIEENEWGPDAPELTRHLSWLVAVYYDKKQYSQVEQLCKRALAILEKVGSQFDADRADIQNLLSALSEKLKPETQINNEINKGALITTELNHSTIEQLQAAAYKPWAMESTRKTVTDLIQIADGHVIINPNSNKELGTGVVNIFENGAKQAVYAAFDIILGEYAFMEVGCYELNAPKDIAYSRKAKLFANLEKGGWTAFHLMNGKYLPMDLPQDGSAIEVMRLKHEWLDLIIKGAYIDIDVQAYSRWMYDYFASLLTMEPEQCKATIEAPVIQQQATIQNTQVIVEKVASDEAKLDLDQLFDEFNKLIGLVRVKSEMRQLMEFVKIQNMRQQKGLGATNISLHSVFYGSPGTGKTTVARIYAKMLKALGLLKKGHLVETDRAGLVANYVGQTANKTDEKIAEALGGVLFIDEAYSLYKGDHAQWDYGSEAIDILMKRMEDNRNDLAVVVAGYPKPMDEFLNSNEGFKSRFVNYIHFEDYTPEELTEIFISIFNQNNYSLKAEALELSKKIIESAYVKKDKSFGNARYCRNLFEEIIRNQALRIGETITSPTDNQLSEIEAQDVMPLMNES